MKSSGFSSAVLFTLACLAVLGSPATGYAAEWFVAPGGTGSGTSGAPFGQIQNALQAAQPGDTITVRPGTYSTAIATMRHGTASSPIVLRAATKGTAIVTWSGNVLSMNHAYNIVDGFVLDGQYGNDRVLKVGSDADASIIRNTEVRRSIRDCVSISSPDNLLIEDSLVHHCLNSAGGRTDAHGISAEAARNLTIRRTEIHTFSGDGIQVDPSRKAPGWDQLTIEGCKIWLAPLPQAEAGFPAGAVTGENAVDTKIYATGPRARLVIRNTEAWGFRNGMIDNMAAFNLKENLDAVIDGVTVWDSEIAFRLRAPAWVTLKNAVMHHVSYGVRYEDNIPQLRVWNTTFGVGVGRPFLAASSSAAGLEVANVLVLGTSLPSEASAASNRTVAASAFVNAASGNYHLAPGSLAVDAGASMVGVQTDRDGTPRPQGAYTDVGAFEFCSTSSCGAPPPPPPPPPPPAPCTYAISPGSRSIEAAGGTGAVALTAATGCAWTAASPAGWVTLGSLTGSGAKSVTYSVSANSSTTARQTTLTIAGRAFSLTQSGATPPPPPPPPPPPASCVFKLDSLAATMTSKGGPGKVGIALTSGSGTCNWAAVTSASWVAIVSGSGSGNGAVTYVVGINKSGKVRSVQITVGGQTHTVTQNP